MCLCTYFQLSVFIFKLTLRYCSLASIVHLVFKDMAIDQTGTIAESLSTLVDRVTTLERAAFAEIPPAKAPPPMCPLGRTGPPAKAPPPEAIRARQAEKVKRELQAQDAN